MSAPIGAADSGCAPSENPEAKEFLIKRDNQRPWSFSGVCLAKQSINSIAGDTLTGAVYRTAGGKFICTLSKDSPMHRLAETVGLKVSKLADYIDETPQSQRMPTSELYNKAEMFDSLDDAIAWFKPGRLTDALRKSLGLDEPIRID